MKIRYTDEGKARLRFVAEWWRENRDKNPYLFEDELEKALELLEDTPEIGERYQKVAGVQWYRLLLKKSRQHVYYCIDRENDVIEIASVWGVQQQHGPLLY